MNWLGGGCVRLLKLTLSRLQQGISMTYISNPKWNVIAPFFVLFAGFLGCSPVDQQATPSRVFVNADVITMNDSQPAAEAVAVQDGKILAVGGREEVEAAAGPGAEIVDLAGKTLLPGFIDSHSHVSMVADKFSAANTDPKPAGPIGSVEDIQDSFRRHIGQKPVAPGKWVLGSGYDHSRLAEKRHPTRDDLDQVSTEYPIALAHFSGHQGVLNTKALEVMGYTAEMPNPEAGTIHRRPGSQEPNGIVDEQAWISVMLKAFRFSLEEKTENLARAVQVYVSKGYTTIQDATTEDPNTSAIFHTLPEQGRLPADVISFVYEKLVPDFPDFQVSRTYDRRFRYGGIKVVLDGGTPGRTAFLREPYYTQEPGEENWRGLSHHADQEELNQILIEAYQRGYSANVHAIGDAALDQAIEALKAAEKAVPGEDRRTNLIHLQVVQEDQLDALSQLDVTLTFQVPHNYYFWDFHRQNTLGPERAERLNPAKSALNRGFHFAVHHDGPIHPVDQLFLIWAAVNRVTDSGYVLGPDQRIPVIEALKAATIHGAYQYFEEDRKGSIETGKLADFVVLSENPLKVDPMTIKDIQVLETIKEGSSVYRRNEL